MISEREKYERFENYLKGLMDQDAKDAFEKDLEQKTELNREFEDYRQAHRMIFESGLLDLRQQLETLHAEKMRSGRSWRAVKNIIIPSVILITGILLYLFLNRQDKFRPVTSGLKDSNDTVENAAMLVAKEGISVVLTDTMVDNAGREKPKHNSNIIIEADGKVTMAEGEVRIVASEPAKAITKPFPSKAENETIRLSATKQRVPETSAETKVLSGEEKDNASLNDCENVTISCGFLAESTCKNAAQGRILFLSQEIKGGNPPYEFSITGGTVFETRMLFDNLPGGQYSLVIRDAGQCASSIGIAAVDETECDFRFAPGLGEVWEIPFITDKEGKLYIFSKTGKLLYFAIVGPSSDRTWSGKSSDGDVLPFGVYVFRMEFPDGSQHNGTVTIIK